MQTDLQNFMTKKVFGQKSQQQQKLQNKKSNIKSLPEPGIEPGTSCIAVWCVTSRPPRQLNISIEVQLFDCFVIMPRSKHKQTSQICGPHIFNKVVFAVLFLNSFTNMYVWLKSKMLTSLVKRYVGILSVASLRQWWVSNVLNLNPH